MSIYTYKYPSNLRYWPVPNAGHQKKGLNQQCSLYLVQTSFDNDSHLNHLWEPRISFLSGFTGKTWCLPSGLLDIYSTQLSPVTYILNLDISVGFGWWHSKVPEQITTAAASTDPWPHDLHGGVLLPYWLFIGPTKIEHFNPRCFLKFPETFLKFP